MRHGNTAHIATSLMRCDVRNAEMFGMLNT